MGIDSAECNIKVICRVRPLNQSEEKAGSKYILKFLSDEALSIGNKNFTYDKVFRHDVSQEEVYNKTAKPIVKDVLSGYNGTIFAYGQTASGKTHTMEGQLEDSHLKGIIPRIVGDIFSYIYNMDNDQIEFHIKVSYFEIYMDKIRDLLDVTKTNLIVHEDKNRVPYVKGVTEQFVSCPADVMQVIEEGKSNRHVAVTNMNEHSSRSHSVFLINVKQVNNETDKKLSGKLYLVDLAGSEKVSKTGAEGSVLDEAKNINKSLSALGNVIAALADNANFVPYRDSKLTRILQESLGGNAQTTMIICCSPASFNETETKSTLLFGSRAKTIKNTVTVNEELTAEEWKRRYEKLKEKNNKLSMLLQCCQDELKRWRAGESVPEGERVASETNSASTLSVVDLKNLPGSGALEAEKVRWEEEKTKLYQQIDDKDEELNSNLEELEKYKEQLLETEEQIKAYIKERDALTIEISRLESENESAKNEIKEVFGALSELAQNYDQKVTECVARKEENEVLTDEQKNNRESIKLLEIELQQLKEAVSAGKRMIVEMNKNLYEDVSSLANTLNPLFKVEATDPQMDVDSGLLRLVLSKMKTELTMVLQKGQQTATELQEEKEKCAQIEKDLSSSKMHVQQLEMRIRSLGESVKEAEESKQTLQIEFDSLNELCSQLKTKEQMYLSQLEENKEHQVASTTQLREALEQQMQLHTQQHSQQIAQLRNQLAAKEKKISQISEEGDELRMMYEALKAEHEQLKEVEASKSAQMGELLLQIQTDEENRKNLKELENVAARELQILHDLRRGFINDLAERIKKTSSPDDEDSFADAKTQKQKIIFLESNLEQLTKVHKNLVRDNTELRGELPKLEKRLRATMERIRALENALKESKETALRDRKRYQQEVDRIKEVVRQKNLLRKGHSATIVKPVRAGHAASPAVVKAA